MNDPFATLGENEDPFRTMAGSAPSDPYCGKQIGNCRLIRKLGEGGMAIVYLARHVLLDVDRVVKILRPALFDFENYKTRFFREARLVARLDHPRIIRVFNAGEHESIFFIEMEYVQGETLRELIIRKKCLDTREAASIAVQIARALDCAHSYSEPGTPGGIVHRDVKPENIIITPTGRVKLMDFGIAKQMEVTSETVPGSVLGTYAYMSPEQVEGREIDSRSDIYSLGVVLYEMLSGKLPYSGKTITKLAMEISEGKLAPLDKEGIPEKMREAVRNSMNPDKEKRYKKASDLANALSPFCDTKIRMENKSKKPNKKIPFLLSVLAIAIAVTLLVILRNPEPVPPKPIVNAPEQLKQTPVSPSSELEKLPPAVNPIPEASKPLVKPVEPIRKIEQPVKKPPVLKEKPQNTVKSPASNAPNREMLEAMELEKQGRWQEAVDAFSRIPAPSMGGNKDHFIDARVRANRIKMNAFKRNDEVIQELSVLFSQFPKPNLANLLAQAYIRQRNYMKAQEVIEKTLRYMSGSKDIELLETKYLLGLALEARILANKETQLITQTEFIWKELIQSACQAGENRWCEQAKSHLEKLNKIKG